MAGDTANAHAWAEADVYTAPLGTTGPTDVTTAWPSGWEALGLLNGEDGFTQSRDQDINDTFAWGGILVRSVRSNQKRSFQVIALEDNDVVFKLVNPGSPDPDTTTTPGVKIKSVMVPKPDKRMFGMELREGSVTKRRYFTGEVMEVDDIQEAEGVVVAYTMTINVYPDASGLLYTELEPDTA